MKNKNEINAAGDLFLHWLQELKKAWVDRTPEILGRICTDDVEYHESPFGPPLKSSAAVMKEWASVPSTQRDILFDFEIICATPVWNTARWHVQFTEISGAKKVEMDGIFLVKLDSGGKCKEFWQWWVIKS